MFFSGVATPGAGATRCEARRGREISDNLRTVNITCSQCDAEVPEGAVSCPKCKAGIGTVVFGKNNQSLTKSLIAKAVELRTSIPWATDSAVVMVDDGTSKSARPGPAALVAIAAVLISVVGGALFYFGVRAPDPQMELTSVQVVKTAAEEQAEARPAVAKTTARAPSTVKPASATSAPTAKRAQAAAPAKKPGTLSVEAIYKGKPVPAKVVVNGEDKGSTPVSVALGAGKYTIKIIKTGFMSAKLQDVQVDAGRNTALKIDLKK